MVWNMQRLARNPGSAVQALPVALLRDGSWTPPQLRPTFRGTLKTQSSPHRKYSQIGSEAHDPEAGFWQPCCFGVHFREFFIIPKMLNRLSSKSLYQAELA